MRHLNRVSTKHILLWTSGEIVTNAPRLNYSSFSHHSFLLSLIKEPFLIMNDDSFTVPGYKDTQTITQILKRCNLLGDTKSLLVSQLVNQWMVHGRSRKLRTSTHIISTACQMNWEVIKRHATFCFNRVKNKIQDFFFHKGGHLGVWQTQPWNRFWRRNLMSPLAPAPLM